MKCSEINNKMIAYLENDLTKAEMSSFQDHLSKCAHCMNVFAEFKKTWQLIEEEKNIQPDSFYFQRIENAIRKSASGKKSPLVYTMMDFGRKAAALILILLSLAAGILIGSGVTGNSNAANYENEYEYFSDLMYLNSSENEPIENYLLNEEE